jgi:4-amino-4-deoxy-L-arabinose transferase-like glycosyltransferase
MAETAEITAAPATAANERRRRWAPPAPLAALLAACALLGVAWALLLPAWQAPDENSHYGYVQSLVDGPGLPGEPDHLMFSSEQLFAADGANTNQTAAAPLTKPEWDPRAYERWRAEWAERPDSQRSDGGGPNPARSNPPLAYLVYAAPYAIFSSGDPFDRLIAMRLVGILWLLGTVLATWALAGEVFGRRPVLQMGAAAIPALAPMPMFISASVSPDAMMYTFWTLAFWLGARMLRRGLTVGNGVAFMATVGLACWIKATSYGLIPGALLAFGWALWRARGASPVRLAVPGLAALAVTVGGWVVLARALARPASEQLTSVATASGLDVRELASYVWQFYLPKLWFMQDFFSKVPITLPVYDTMLQGVWGRFGWLEIGLPEPVYWLLTAVTIAIVALAAISLWRLRRGLDRAVLAFLAVVALTLLAGLHWQEYRLVLGGAGLFMQGRYLLPLVGIAGLIVAAALCWFAPRRRPTAVAGVISGLFALQILSLGLIVERFYA